MGREAGLAAGPSSHVSPGSCVLAGPPPREDGWALSLPWCLPVGAALYQAFALEEDTGHWTLPSAWYLPMWQVDNPVSPPLGAPHWGRGAQGSV